MLHIVIMKAQILRFNSHIANDNRLDLSHTMTPVPVPSVVIEKFQATSLPSCSLKHARNSQLNVNCYENTLQKAIGSDPHPLHPMLEQSTILGSVFIEGAFVHYETTVHYIYFSLYQNASVTNITSCIPDPKPCRYGHISLSGVFGLRRQLDQQWATEYNTSNKIPKRIKLFCPVSH